MKVKFKKLHPDAQVPTYATDGSSGADLYACLECDEHITLFLGDRAVIATGIAVKIPAGYEAQIRSRSGLALKAGVVVLNSPGTVDSDYRGEVKVILHNASDVEASIEHGDRIAQIVFAPVVRAEFVEGELDETERGAGGFGSTGK